MAGWGWTKVHHPDHVDPVVAGIQKSWNTGEPWEDTFPLRGRDGGYRWFRFNDAVCSITGYSRHELEKKTFADISHADDTDRDCSEAGRLQAGEIPTYSVEPVPPVARSGHRRGAAGLSYYEMGAAWAVMPRPVKESVFLAWLARAISVSSLNRTVRRQNDALERYARTLEGRSN